MKPLLISCFGLLICFAGNAQKVISEPVSKITDDWNVLSDSEFTIRYPVEWSLDQSGLVGSSFFLYSPLDTIEDSFRENFNLMVNDLSEFPGISLDELAEGARQQILAIINYVKILEYKEIVTEGDRYYVVEYTGTQGHAQLHWRQHYRISDNKFYILTFTAEQHQIDRYIPVAELIFASFFLK